MRCGRGAIYLTSDTMRKAKPEGVDRQTADEREGRRGEGDLAQAFRSSRELQSSALLSSCKVSFCGSSTLNHFQFFNTSS